MGVRPSPLRPLATAPRTMADHLWIVLAKMVAAGCYHARVGRTNSLQTIGFSKRLYLLVDVWRLCEPADHEDILHCLVTV